MHSKITYRQQFTRCGKQRCRKCKEGEGHGPYWYAYWSEKGRTVSKYVGSRLPADVASARQASTEAVEQTTHIARASTATSPTLRVYLLGQFRVERKSKNEWKIVDNRIWQRRRARALLGCLLSSPGRRLGREQVMEQLWPDLDIDIAANRLNGAVHELRQILEPDLVRPAASRMLRLERDILELADSTQIWVDVEVFENLLKEAQSVNKDTHPEQAERLLEEAASLYGGSYLLEELYSEWAAHRRDALQRRWVGLLLDLAHLRAQQGNIVSAIETLDRLRVAEPTNETALQRLMVLLTQLDRRGEALQLYRQHVTMLRREYESEPLPETHNLYEALRKGILPASHVVKPQIKAQKGQKVHTIPSTEPLPIVTRELPFVRPVFQLGRQNRSPLVGRDGERDVMRQAMLTIEAIATSASKRAENATQESTQRVPPPPASSTGPRQPHFLLLTGEPGIGKTRLSEELSIEANTRGWAVAWSRAYEQEGNIPYHPWIELLRTLLQGVSIIPDTRNGSSPSAEMAPSHYVQSSLNFQLERLSTLLPELLPHMLASSTRASIPYEQERLHLWEATLGLLSNLSKTHPLLLVLDDLHWTDDSSLELLTYLTHHLQDQRVLLVGTCRDSELAPTHKLRTLIADLRREQAIITLPVQPLTQSQIGTLVSHLPKDIVQHIQIQASGNPFFAEELARYVGTTTQSEDLSASPTTQAKRETDTRAHTLLPAPLHAQSKAGHDLFARNSLPEAVAALLERRLSRLNGECQTLLGKAAVLGGSFELGQLLPMVPEHQEDTILDLLEEALQEGLLTEEGTGTHITYHFWHPLIVSHLYKRLSAARRAQLHRRAADAIRETHISSAQEKVAAAIFYHLSRGGDTTHIAYYAELAGNQAYLLAAYFEAQYYYMQAALAIAGAVVSDGATSEVTIERINSRLLAHPPLPSHDRLRLCRLLEFTAECSMVLGNFEDARSLYECILVLRTSSIFQQQVISSTTEGEIEHQQEAQIQALLWREIGATWVATGGYDHAYECNKRGKEVLHKAGITTGAAWAYLHLHYGSILRYEGNYQEALRYTQEALEVLEQVVYRPPLEHMENASPRSGLNQGLTVSSFSATNHPSGQSNRDLQKLYTRTERALFGDPMHLGFAYEHLGIIAASLGQVSDGLTHLHAALILYEQQEAFTEVVRVSGNLGAVYIMKGEHSSARTFLHRSLDLAERIGDLPNLGFIAANLGDVAYRSGELLEAEGWFMRSLTLTERVNDREHMSWCNVILANIQQDLGKLREATASLHRAISVGRAIKSSRCIRFALVSLGDFRILEAIIACKLQSPEKEDSVSRSATRLPSLPDGQQSGKEDRYLQVASCQRLLLRAKSTLQRAISQEEVETETIIDCKLLLATVSFLQDDLATARRMALQTLQEAQEQETLRVIGRAQRLLGRILAAQGHYEEGDSCFEQALQIFREQELRLDYARTLHSYGITFVQRSLSHPKKVQTSAIYQRGINYLQEARNIFTTSHAAIDLTWVENALASYEYHALEVQ